MNIGPNKIYYNLQKGDSIIIEPKYYLQGIPPNKPIKIKGFFDKPIFKKSDWHIKRCRTLLLEINIKSNYWNV